MRTRLLLSLLLFSGSLLLQAQLQRGDQLLSVSGLQVAPGETVSPLLGDNLAVLRYFPQAAGGGGVLAAGIDYGYLLTDRLAVGGSLVGILGIGSGEGDGAAALNPYLRYYAINRPDLMAFGQLNVGTLAVNQGEFFDEGYALSAGVHLPLAAGILATPMASYQFNRGRNLFTVGAGVTLVLGKNNRPDERPAANLQRGDVLLGAQSLSLGTREGVLTFGGGLGGYYFLSSRFALGLALEGSRTRIEFGQRGTDAFVSSRLGFGAGARYYLTTTGRSLWFTEIGISRDRYRVDDGFRTDFTVTQTSLLGGGGLQWFIRDNVALEVGPQLRYYTSDDELTVNANFGIRFRL